jgi:hypothetical protein
MMGLQTAVVGVSLSLLICPAQTHAGRDADRNEALTVKWSWRSPPNLYPDAPLVRRLPGATERIILRHRGRRVANELRRVNSLRKTIWRRVYKPRFVDGAAMVIDKDRVFVARFSRIASGCWLRAYSAKTGKLLWKTTLKGIVTGHSKYYNMVQMRLDSSQSRVVVFGWEAHGRYIELRDVTSGKLLGHRRLPSKRRSHPLAGRLYREIKRALHTRGRYQQTIQGIVKRWAFSTTAKDVERAIKQVDGQPLDDGLQHIKLTLSKAGRLVAVKVR